MYKNVLLTLFITFIAGCSAPKPDIAPQWYTNVPTNSEFYYAVGASDTIENATKAAVESMRESLSTQLNNGFKKTTHILQPIDNETLEKIFAQSSDISKKLSFQKIKLEKSKKTNNRELVLISVPRLELFEKLKPISDALFLRMKQEYKMHKNSTAVKKLAFMDELMKNFPRVASLTGYKNFLIHSYSADDEFKFLKEMRGEYDYLKSTINIYVLSDANSKIFANQIKAAITQKGISTENSIENENSVKLLITSDTTDTQNYNFLQSKSLVKFTTFDKEKKQIAFRQHTFMGQSSKNYQDAKEHSATDMQAKIKNLSLFDFIGIENK